MPDIRKNNIRFVTSGGDMIRSEFATNGQYGVVDRALVAVDQIARTIISTIQTDLQTHIGNTNNPHGVTKTQVGLSAVNNTADSAKNVLSATKLTTARTITVNLATSGGGSFDGSVITQIFDNFTILVKVGIESINTQSYNSDGLPVFEERIVIRLAKRTAAEIQMEKNDGCTQSSRINVIKGIPLI